MFQHKKRLAIKKQITIMKSIESNARSVKSINKRKKNEGLKKMIITMRTPITCLSNAHGVSADVTYLVKRITACGLLDAFEQMLESKGVISVIELNVMCDIENDTEIKKWLISQLDELEDAREYNEFASLYKKIKKHFPEIDLKRFEGFYHNSEILGKMLIKF